MTTPPTPPALITAAAGSDTPDTAGGLAVRCEGVVHVYPGAAPVTALRGVDLDIPAGGRVALIGPSGCGKSTLLTLLAGMNRPTAGRLLLGGQDVSGLTDRDLTRLRGRRVGTVLQSAGTNLLPYATPLRNVAFARLALTRAEARRAPAAHDLLDALGLSRVATRPLRELSGGEQQRVAIAVAVANTPRLLLADEPTSQLDAATATTVLDLLDDVHHRAGTTLVLVTHDPLVAARYPRAVSMRDGRVGADGRLDAQHAVIGRDLSVHLPEELRPTWPPGTPVTVQPAGAELRIRRIP